jgi:hypothetical protein
LILGIDGPPGEGKTFAVAGVAESSSVETVMVSGGQLESPHSGKPAELIRDAYRIAGGLLTSGRAAGAVVVINDIDGGIGDWGPTVQYTVNRQNVITELMHLCDHPETVEGTSTPRVPIIVTGNDFSKLYGPLIRAGRFRRFTWVPTLPEKVAVVGGILPVDLAARAADLVHLHPEQPVSFFADVITFAQDRTIMRAVRQRGFDAAVAAARAGSFPRIDAAITFELLKETSQGLLRDQATQNHLE